MSDEKPENMNEYLRWLKEKHKADISERASNYYQSVTTRIVKAFEISDFWKAIKENFREFDSQYRLQTGYPLWVADSSPELDIKSYDSFLLKTFRKNVLENKRWPRPPKDDWFLPHNWFTKINDIIRTRFVVKYLDGVEFVIKSIKPLCDSFALEQEDFLEARDEGYYAAHLYVKPEFEIPKITWDTERVCVFIELQITTQLQDAIGQLTHKYYEVRRERVSPRNTKWQWDYTNDEFVANYLGHILHYLEGMIMEIREKQNRSRNE